MATGPLIRDVHVRFHREEVDLLHRIAERNRLAQGTVVRAMVRHFLVEFEAGRPAPPELGAIRW